MALWRRVVVELPPFSLPCYADAADVEETVDISALPVGGPPGH